MHIHMFIYYILRIGRLCTVPGEAEAQELEKARGKLCKVKEDPLTSQVPLLCSQELVIVSFIVRILPPASIFREY